MVIKDDLMCDCFQELLKMTCICEDCIAGHNNDVTGNGETRKPYQSYKLSASHKLLIFIEINLYSRSRGR